MCVCLCVSQGLIHLFYPLCDFVTPNLCTETLRGGYCPMRAWMCFEEVRGAGGVGVMMLFVCKVFSHFTLLCPEQKGLEREIM